MKISITLAEHQTISKYFDPIEIETDNYPELKDMDVEEVQDYLEENLYKMKPTDGNEMYSLYDEIVNSDDYDERYGDIDTVLGVEEVE